jgi:type I restriction enzyme S subunit
VGKYVAYPAYKDSGVEWLGKIPEHWDSVALRWISKRYSGGTPDKKNDDYWYEGTIPWLNSGSVNQQVITKPSAYITIEAVRNIPYAVKFADFFQTTETLGSRGFLSAR